MPLHFQEEVDRLIDILQQYKQENELLRQQSSQMLNLIQRNRLSLTTHVLENKNTVDDADKDMESTAIAKATDGQFIQNGNVFVNPLNEISVSKEGNIVPESDRYASLNRNFEERSVTDIVMHSCETGQKMQPENIDERNQFMNEKLSNQTDESSHVVNSSLTHNLHQLKALDVKPDIIDSGIMISNSSLSPYRRPLCYKTLKTVYPQNVPELKVLPRSDDSPSSVSHSKTEVEVVRPKIPLRKGQHQENSQKPLQRVTNYHLQI